MSSTPKRPGFFSRLIKSRFEKPARAMALRAWRISRQIPSSGVGINVVGYFHGAIGLGEAARILADQFESQGQKVYRINLPLDFPSRVDPSLCPNVDSEGMGNVTVIVGNPEMLAYVVRCFFGKRVLRAPKVVGYWFWEQTELPRSWIRDTYFVDEVWVPTTFLQHVFERNCPGIRIVKIPILQAVVKRRIAIKGKKPKRKRITVLTVYDQASTYWRKRPDLAWEVFKRAREMLPEVALSFVLHANRFESPSVPEDERVLQLEVSSDPDGAVSWGPISRQNYIMLCASCHVLLATFCAEGLGLPLMEAKALGLEVAATGWSGIVEDNPNLFHRLPFKLEQPKLGNTKRIYETHGSWAYVDVEGSAKVLAGVIKRVAAIY